MKLANKRILVTGADGFIGSYLAEILKRRGYCAIEYRFFSELISDAGILVDPV